MIDNNKRFARFTSSNIYKLMTNGRAKGTLGSPALEYIKEKRLETRLGRPLEIETYSRAMAWGIFLEQRVLDLLGFEYQLVSDETKTHPEMDLWAGSQDLLVEGKKISDIKCYQPKNFALYTDALMLGDIENLKKEFPKEYWQLVSNAIINNVPNAEAITYMPYRSELITIREMASNYMEDDQWKYRFIYEEKDENLAYLPDNGYYKNLNKFEFTIPEEDKLALTERVKMAIELLKENK